MIKARAKCGLALCALVTLVAPVAALGADAASSGHGGVITGSVRLQGEVPKLAPLEITKAKDICKDVPNETLVIGPQKGIRYAVITLEGVPKATAGDALEVPHELDNVGCRFVPHVQAVGVDQFLQIKNTDPILHTAHALFASGQPQFNIGLYPGKVVRKPLVSPGVVKIICEVHPWMSAYVVVTGNPYHAVTDIYGEYDIREVPRGSYRLKVWHERLGTEEKAVEVKDGATSKVDFTFSSAQGAGK